MTNKYVFYFIESEFLNIGGATDSVKQRKGDHIPSFYPLEFPLQFITLPAAVEQKQDCRPLEPGNDPADIPVYLIRPAAIIHDENASG